METSFGGESGCSTSSIDGRVRTKLTKHAVSPETAPYAYWRKFGGKGGFCQFRPYPHDCQTTTHSCPPPAGRPPAGCLPHREAAASKLGERERGAACASGGGKDPSLAEQRRRRRPLVS